MIHSFNKHLLTIYYTLSTKPGAEKVKIKKINPYFDLYSNNSIVKKGGEGRSKEEMKE